MGRNSEQSFGNPSLKPFKLWVLLLLFFVPAAVMCFCVYVFWPYLIKQGMTSEAAYVFATSLTTGGMFVASFIAYILEGNPLNWALFSRRFRINKMSLKAWLWTLGGLVALLAVSVLANNLLGFIYKIINFTPPSISPNITSVVLLTIMLFLNIVGEEFWWRGYIQPRQELTFGNLTYIVHGVLWSVFHMFKWWAVPAMMLVCMIIPFIAQRTKNTVPGLIMHLIQNGLGIVMLLITK